MEKVDVEQVRFLINIYDQDRDIVDTGIFLHFGNLHFYLKIGDTKDLGALRDQLEKIKKEIEETYALPPME